MSTLTKKSQLSSTFSPWRECDRRSKKIFDKSTAEIQRTPFPIASNDIWFLPFEAFQRPHSKAGFAKGKKEA